jgi:hypothetical protein
LVLFYLFVAFCLFLAVSLAMMMSTYLRMMSCSLSITSDSFYVCFSGAHPAVSFPLRVCVWVVGSWMHTCSLGPCFSAAILGSMAMVFVPVGFGEVLPYWCSLCSAMSTCRSNTAYTNLVGLHMSGSRLAIF